MAGEGDLYGVRHAARVATLAEAAARRLGWERRQVALVRVGSTLHDVGKLTLRHSLLGKVGRLTDEEFEEIRSHPMEGAKLLEQAAPAESVLNCVLYHHERWDGGGYPAGRMGVEIPVEARLLAVADAFDAMVSDRPYRRALPVEQALAELRRCAGSQFDPALAEAFVEICAARASPRARHTAAV